MERTHRNRGEPLTRSGSGAKMVEQRTAASRIVTLADDRLYALPNPYQLDGRVSTHPPEARGFAPMNSYLVVEDDRALLLDTGWSVHQDTLLAQLDSLLDPSMTLSIWPIRIQEFTSVCNTRAVVSCNWSLFS